MPTKGILSAIRFHRKKLRKPVKISGQYVNISSKIAIGARYRYGARRPIDFAGGTGDLVERVVFRFDGDDRPMLL